MKAQVHIAGDIQCDGCGCRLWLEVIDNANAFYCSTPQCKNFGKKFKAPSIELEEIQPS